MVHTISGVIRNAEYAGSVKFGIPLDYEIGLARKPVFC